MELRHDCRRSNTWNSRESFYSSHHGRSIDNWSFEAQILGDLIVDVMKAARNTKGTEKDGVFQCFSMTTQHFKQIVAISSEKNIGSPCLDAKRGN